MKLERRDRFKVGFLLFLMILTPLSISYIYANVDGLSSVTPITYNITDVTEGSGNGFAVTEYNASLYDSASQTETYDNSTGDIIIAAFNIDDIDSPTHTLVTGYLNTTFLADSQPTRIDFVYTYVGTGNLTYIGMSKTEPVPSKTIIGATEGVVTENNGTFTWIPEVFEAITVATITKMYINFAFMDSSNLPTDGDYISIRVIFYESTSLLSQTQLLETIAGGMGFVLFMAGAAISPFWNPNTSYRRRR